MARRKLKTTIILQNGGTHVVCEIVQGWVNQQGQARAKGGGAEAHDKLKVP